MYSTSYKVFFLVSYVSPHELPELTTLPFSLPISSSVLCWTLSIFKCKLPKIHSIALKSAAAFRVRTRRVSILCACATSVPFVLRLFVKRRNLAFFYPPWDFFCYDNSDEIWIKYFEVLQEYIYIYIGARGGVVVKTLRYKPGGRGFDSRWCYSTFPVTWSFRSHYGPGVDSASNRNEYQVYFLGLKAAGA